jgi:DNA transformation protein
MSSLTTQINIGSVLAQKLAEIGITTIEELRAVGTEQAFIKLETLDCTYPTGGIHLEYFC